MTVFWGIILAAPLLTVGGGMVLWGGKTRKFLHRFGRSRIAASVLVAAAWAWTAYECDHMGIDVFDMMLKIFPGQLWLMAAVLTWLVIIWMPGNLTVRALSGIFMLCPAALFRTTRLYLPASGFAMVHILVATGYVMAITGMYGMFYPWRLEKLYAFVSAHPRLHRDAGFVLVAWGLAVLAAGGLA